MGRLNLASIAPEKEVELRLSELATEFEYTYRAFTTPDEFAEKTEDEQVSVVVFSGISVKNSSEISGAIQVIKQLSPESFVIVLVDKKISPDSVNFIKKSGANLILLENSFYQTSEVEYICSQTIRGSLIPIKASELKANTTIDFPVMVVMPLNKKVLPVASAGATLSEQRYAKLLEAKELYIRRDDLAKFQSYTEKNIDLSAAGLASRCRLKYLNLCKAHSELVYLLIDQAEASSFSAGKILLEDCERLANDLLSNLASVEDPFSIINNSSIGESGSTERSTAIASMAGVMSLNLVNVSPNNVVLAGLLSDFGLLELEPKILKKIRKSGIKGLSDEEMNSYKLHPIGSINMCLSRKLPLPDKVKNIIMHTHEYHNGKGFPKGTFGERIPLEAQVILYTQLVDEASIVKMGERKRPVKELQKEILEQEFLKLEKFGPKIVSDLRKAI